MSSIRDVTTGILACPHCGGELAWRETDLMCSSCSTNYPVTSTGQLDLRSKHERIHKVSFTTGTSGYSEFDRIGSIEASEAPAVDFSQVRVPHHLTREILSHFPKASGKDALALDLGCGDEVHRTVCEQAGFRYVGLDYSNAHARILGDAHCLPFKTGTFEFILCIAVLEHIRFPFVMMQEVFRVLKPGGLLLGTSAFLEPYHDGSFYHHTHRGISNTVESAGLEIKMMAANANWNCLFALSSGLFPGMPRAIRKVLVAPLYFLHRVLWRCAGFVNDRATESLRLCKTSGSVFFTATKPISYLGVE